MSEATLGLAVLIFALVGVCLIGFILVCPWPLYRLFDWWEKRRA